MAECPNFTAVTPEYMLFDLNNHTNTSDLDGDYDGFGAMKFIISTVTVYAAMGVFCTLINNIRKKPNKHKRETQDEAVIKYLKQEKTLKLQGFHMQLQSLRNKYTEMVRQYDERMRLAELRKHLESMDTGSPGLKRSRNTRKLSLFNIHHGIKDKFSSRKRPSMDQAIGRVGFSLLHGWSKDPRLPEEDEDESRKIKDPLNEFRGSDNRAKSVTSVREAVRKSSDTCVVDIEHYEPKGRTPVPEAEYLLPPVNSYLSESV